MQYKEQNPDVICEALISSFEHLRVTRNVGSIGTLAKESKVSLSTIYSIIYGHSKNPGIITIKKLCDYFGITLGEFFAGEKFLKLYDKKTEEEEGIT